MPVWEIMAIMAVVTAVALAIDPELLMRVSVLTGSGSFVAILILKAATKGAAATGWGGSAVLVWLMSWVMLFIGAASLPESTSSSTPAATGQTEVESASVGGEWWEGGTLFQADIREWRQATSSNRVATAAALAYGVLESRGLDLQALGGPDGLRPYADDLVYCISDGTAMDGEAIERLEVREITAMCIVQMGDAWGGSR